VAVHMLYAVCIQTSASILRHPRRSRLDEASEVSCQACGILLYAFF
jgi:hypothetical protein